MKRFNSILLLVLCWIIIPDAFAKNPTYAVDPITDLALIYQGGVKRPDWNVKDLEPYVAHKFANGKKEWLFDGFLFLEFSDGMDNAFGNGMAKNKAKKEHWEWLLNRVFEKNKGLDALDKCIGKMKKELGEPSFRHKVVIALPSALMKQTDWGTLDGKALDFNNQDDQTKAEIWYIDKLLKRYEKQNYKNFDLEGLYWLDEDSIHCKSLPARISPYIHSKGLRFYWIPYFKARGFDKWRELGFDIVYHQPNHFFSTDIPDSRLDLACEVADAHGMAMEFEMDRRAIHNSKEKGFTRRMEEYMDAFDRHDVWEKSAVAYYTGTKGFMELGQSKDPRDIELIDRFASIIVRRQAMRKNDNCPVSTVKVKGDDVFVTTALNAEQNIIYQFRKCMFNNLFTFYKVGFANKNDMNNVTFVNVAESDNIGPLGIQNGGWTGGNHSYRDKNEVQTAETYTLKIYADNKEIGFEDAEFEAKQIKLQASNIIYNPLKYKKVVRKFGEVLCKESVEYIIRGGSIQVKLAHHFNNADSVMLTKYYGMQSMFRNEAEILTPNGKYAQWTPIKNVDRFKKGEFPQFRHFIEKSNAGYQSTYLLNSGIGTHKQLGDDDMIFIGNSYTKSYHQQLGAIERKAGDIDYWSGVYTWFTEPLMDNENVFAFAGAVDGHAALFVSCKKDGKYTIPLTDEMWQNRERCKAPGLKFKLAESKIQISLSAGFDGYILF